MRDNDARLALAQAQVWETQAPRARSSRLTELWEMGRTLGWRKQAWVEDGLDVRD